MGMRDGSIVNFRTSNNLITQVSLFCEVAYTRKSEILPLNTRHISTNVKLRWLTMNTRLNGSMTLDTRVLFAHNRTASLYLTNIVGFTSKAES